MASVALSAGVRQALTSIQLTASQQSTVQNRLATGKKVNSALDNPTSFFTASGLSSRASDLTGLLDDMGQAVRTLEAADKALTAIGRLVDNAKSIARQAKAADKDVAAAGAKVTGTVDLDGFTAAAAGTFRIAVGDGAAATVTVAEDDTAADIASAIATAGGTGFTADVDADTGRLTLQAPTGSDGGPQLITISVDDTDAASIAASQALLSDLGLSTGTTSGTNAKTARADLQKDLDGIMEQINQLAADASYNGVNLLDGDTLKVQFNEENSSKLDITGNTTDAAGLKIDSLSLAEDADIERAISSLKTATDTLRSRSASFGANLSVVQNRQDFTKGMIDTLNTGSDQLTLADPNEEGAKLLSLNTRGQLAGTALSLAAQQDQAVLRLF